MSAPRVSIWFEHEDESLSVRRYTVSEAMNQPFEIDLEAVSADDDLDLEAFVGKAARFAVRGTSSRSLEGVVARMRLVRWEPGGLSTYRIAIAPRMWLLVHRSDNRVFQHLSIPSIVREVLAAARVEATFRVDEASHPKHEYRVQYDETDWAFVSRLCEEAGIAFFFGPDSKLAFADAPSRVEPRTTPIPYLPERLGAPEGDSFERIELRDEVRPGRYTLRDHDFRRHPTFELFGKRDHEHDVESELERYHYRPGSTWIMKDGNGGETPAADDRGTARACPAAGQARAKKKLESLRAGKFEVTLEGTAIDLSPGVVFHVAGHTHRELRAERGLLVVESRVAGDVSGEWSAHVVAHFADAPYRPPHRTPRPRIDGVQSAIVVGAEGEEIHTDEFGRVRVQFHWDRCGKRNHKSSCWVRVGQGWAGGGQGMLVLPRVGQEVLVAYLDGDVDRPVIVGRAYNATAPVPHALPANKTKSSWKSESSPRTGGFNEISMEDASGDELLHLHAQKDLLKRVNNNANHSIGNSLSEFVGNNKELIVGSSEQTAVAMASTKTVGVRYSLTVGGPAAAAAQSLSAARIGDAVPDAAPVQENPRVWMDAPGSQFIMDGGVSLWGGDGVHVASNRSIELSTKANRFAPKRTIITLEVDVIRLKSPKIVMEADAVEVTAPGGMRVNGQRVMTSK